MEPKHMSVKCTLSKIQSAAEQGRPLKLAEVKVEKKKED
jgi:hypothetical protein